VLVRKPTRLQTPRKAASRRGAARRPGPRQLFDKAPSGSTTATVTTAAHAQVALQGAEEGTVLLKNNGILPLSTSGLSSVAVIGVDGGAGTLAALLFGDVNPAGNCR
jgi:beta-glucosidase-like glycosyl hydrolase